MYYGHDHIQTKQAGMRHPISKQHPLHWHQRKVLTRQDVIIPLVNTPPREKQEHLGNEVFVKRGLETLKHRQLSKQMSDILKLNSVKLI